MVSSVVLSPLSSVGILEKNGDVGCSSLGTQKSSFLQNPKLLFVPSSIQRKPRTSTARRCSYKAPVAKHLDHIPKQFREENLNDGLMDNYKSVPRSLYGLSPSQMDMFLTEDNPVHRQAQSVTEESISSSHNYLNNGGMWSMSGMDEKRSLARYSMSASMYRGGRGYGRRRTPPPDLPSLLLDARIVYLGMPIVPAVTELIVAQFMWLDYDSQTKPIHLYLNSSGTQNEKMETVGAETDAYAIADAMRMCKADVYTANVAMAYGQAAMLLSLGVKGHRGLQPNSCTKIYLPKVHRSSGPAADMWIKAKEIDANKQYYIELLAKGTGKTEEEIARDVRGPRFFNPEGAIEYGIADRIILSTDMGVYETENYNERLARAKAARGGAGAGPQTDHFALR